MGKIGLIIRREYLAKVRNKSFVIMTFLSPILLVGMIVLIAYLTKVNDNEKRQVAVLNQSRDFTACSTCRTGKTWLPLRKTPSSIHRTRPLPPYWSRWRRFLKMGCGPTGCRNWA